LLNNRDSKYTENSLELDEQIKNSTENLSKEIIQVLSSQLKSSSQNKLLNTSNNNNNNNNNNERNSNDLMKKTAKKMNKSTDNLNRLTNTTSTTTSTNSSSLSSKKKDSSRSVSLNDLLNMDIENDSIYLDSKFNNNKNNLNMIKCGSDAKSASTHTPTTTTTPSINKRTKMPNKEMNNLISKSTNSILSGKTNIKQSYLFPPPPPPTILNKQQHQTTTNNNNNNKQQLQSILKNSENSISSPPSQLATTLSSTSMMLIQNPSNQNLNDLLAKRIDLYKCKQMPKERLEIDILPSYLSFAQNKLLIASTNGRIRVIDLFSYKIQKDELKNILINGICIPKYFNDFNSDMFYTVSNAEMKNQQNDPLCVSNSVVIVTKNELRVLKKKDPNDNDNYLFSNPSGICYDDYGNLYVSDTGNNRIKILDQNLLFRCCIDTASQRDDLLCQPKSLACYQNILYVCDSGKHRIVAYYILYSGEEFRFKNIIGYGFGNDLGMLRYPVDVCTDDLGIVCVRDAYNSRVQFFNGVDSRPFHFIDTNNKTTTTTMKNKTDDNNNNSNKKECIYSMTIASNGDIYVAKMVNYQECDPNTGQIQTLNKYFIDIY
jgi:hypothetical protein